MAHENCDTCNTDYDFTKENATLHLYLEDVEANFIEAICPNCKGTERMYATADTILHLIQTACMNLAIHARADETELERAANAWNQKEDSEALPELPELPVAWRVQLYDDLRNWRGEV